MRKRNTNAEDDDLIDHNHYVLLQVIYHNWRHALNVAQTMFVIIKVIKRDAIHLFIIICEIFLFPKFLFEKRCNLRRFLDPKEQLALIMASICHDLDHRGLNNSFQSRFEMKIKN